MTFEKDETPSVFVVEPTLTAVETQAGALREFDDPPFPEAATVAIPTDLRLSMIGLYGSPSQFDEKRPSPRLRFAAAKECWSRRRYTRSRPAMTSELQPATHGAKKPQSWNRSNRENTWTAITDAPLATPENDLPAGPLPAAIPATCVPWSHPKSASEQLTPDPGPTCSSWPFGQSVVLCGLTLLE